MRTKAGLRAGFARALRQRRTVMRVSQEELADRADLHRTYVSALERGLKSPSLGAIEALATALELRPHELIIAAEEAAEGQLRWDAAGGSLTPQTPEPVLPREVTAPSASSAREGRTGET
jgi:transcriptional regulator with XRE-family HTH domain